MFSNVGKALLGPLFKRQSSGVHQPAGLSKQLRACLEEIHALLSSSCMPMHTLLCQVRDVRPTGGCRRASPDVLQNSSNGWGAVFAAPQGFRQAFRSAVPVEVLRKTATSKAFIFWLEMLAQVFAVLAVLQHVRGHLLCFVDNSAAQHALAKGYSKDVSFTKVVGCFSRFLASKGVALSFHRVTSSANVSNSVSREDWSLAKELRCQLEEFDFNEGYLWLSRVSEEDQQALFPKFVQFAHKLRAQTVEEQRAEVE